jgi:predicted lipoprotein with Yx(FWY)xxD motif
MGEKTMMKRIMLTVAAIAISTAALAEPMTTTVAMGSNKILADAKGMVLYTYDKDTKGAAASACTGGCAGIWPAYVAAASDKAGGDWTIVNGLDKDGKTAVKQWAYKGVPVYYYSKDAKAGDAMGDGAGGGAWHVIKA